MVATPVLPAATAIGLANTTAAPPLKVAFAAPLLLPMVMVPVPKALATVPMTVPASIVVPPEYALAPDRVRVPTPPMLSAPVVAALAPLNVRLFAATLMSIALLVAAASVNARLVANDAPVYCSVPPPSTRFPAAAVDAPMLLAAPPLARVLTLT